VPRGRDVCCLCGLVSCFRVRRWQCVVCVLQLYNNNNNRPIADTCDRQQHVTAQAHTKGAIQLTGWEPPSVLRWVLLRCQGTNAMLAAPQCNNISSSATCQAEVLRVQEPLELPLGCVACMLAGQKSRRALFPNQTPTGDKQWFHS
jgi:hypothetical protein